MNSKIDLVMSFTGTNDNFETIALLKKEYAIENIILLVNNADTNIPENCEKIVVKSSFSSVAIREIVNKVSSEMFAVLLKSSKFESGQFCFERMIKAGNDSQAGIVYSDYYEILNGEITQHPTIEYQTGSVRDDFNFGGCLIINTEAAKNAVSNDKQDYEFAGLYNLRLLISQKNRIIRIPEFLYSLVETDARKSGEKQFDYVDPKNRQVQIEMEAAFTNYLKGINAFVGGNTKPVNFNMDFETEVSVIIPVKNRASTISDAIHSVIKQKTDFKFNIIIIDNYSTDGTKEIIENESQHNSDVILHTPDRKDLGIGGCWNEGLFHPKCGKFAVQLDSDDLYKDENTLQTIVNKFYEEKSAMVIGSYQMTNFDLEEIPPGLIDHKEWTDENGRNNALRINGLGAPRAFYTPVLREILVPNVSYGEDYAVGLAISRKYKISRIYTSIYLCRRWDGNSDSSLSIEKLNANNHYKDKIRTLEIFSRINMNKSLNE